MAENENSTPEAEEPQAPKGKIPLKLVILFTLLLSLFGGAFLVWKGGLLAKFVGNDETSTREAEASQPLAQPDIGPIYGMKTYIVNLVDPRGKRYLKTKIELELNNEALSEEIERRLPQLRDSVLTTLSGKSYEDVSTLEGKYQLRAEIVALLNQYLQSGQITNLYFTEFIVQ
jgi:flagellar FliL protein